MRATIPSRTTLVALVPKRSLGTSGARLNPRRDAHPRVPTCQADENLHPRVGWATWLHAVNDTALLEGVRNGRGNFFAYVVPIVVGIIVIIFMIKPLFARRAKTPPSFEITRAQEPRIFACRACRAGRAAQARCVR